jgi:Cell wall-active antibiotics response LiaF, C-terminal
MADAPVPSLARARELKIEELSAYFANDDLSLEDLERRIERVYRSSSVAELETITSDLRGAAMVPADYVRANVIPGTAGVPTRYEVPHARMLSLMSTTKRVGRWALARKLDLLAVMSDTRIDLTHAVLQPGISEIHMRAVMASVKVIVPPGVRVVVDAHSVMASVQSKADELFSDSQVNASEPVIRLTGFALMADVNVVVRRREDALMYVDDDD